MVVASRKQQQQRPLSACSDDSLARSLHKDIATPVVNVSHKADEGSIGPDRRYPTLPGQRKRQNTLLDTGGWHTCFKNNNYVFVRNSRGDYSSCVETVGLRNDEDGKEKSSDVTFVISTTKPISNEKQGKMVVSLQDTKTKTRRVAPQPPTNAAVITPSPKNTTPIETVSSQTKKKSSWLKRFKTPSRNKLVTGTPEEKTPIYISTPSTGSEEEAKNTSDIEPNGPHTSTPKEGLKAERYQTLPQEKTATPRRPQELRHSVRRRLPYSERSVDSGTSLDLLQVSPVKRSNTTRRSYPPEKIYRTVSMNIPNQRFSAHEIPPCEKPHGVTSLVDTLHPGVISRKVSSLVRQPKSKNEEARKKKSCSLPEVAESGSSTEVLTSSEPALTKSSGRDVPLSPMELEENLSLRSEIAEDSTVTFSPLRSTQKEGPVSCWLREIRLLTDNECLNALQAKELSKDSWVANALAVGNAQEACEKIWELGSEVQQRIQEMKDEIKTTVGLSTLKVAQFCSAVVQLFKWSHCPEKRGTQLETKIKKICSKLLDTSRGSKEEGWKSQTIDNLISLQELLENAVRQLLLPKLQVIADIVEQASDENGLKRSVFALILLGRVDPIFCNLSTQLGAIRGLLSICVEKKWRELHSCALRALTVLTSVPSAIAALEELGGVECVSDVLRDTEEEESVKSEAAGLIAQMTAPWTEGSHFVLETVQCNASYLVPAIANLAAKTQSSEAFLLASAALANLSFAEEVLPWMKENKVLETLVEACRNNPHASSLFIKDQVATVLANVAAKQEFREVVIRGGGLVLLLCFLQLRPSVGHAAPQLAACERVQQKAAIALARLCADPDTSNVVADMQGIQRLVKLCKDRKERNNSDSVLVACLAALRKIAAVRQKEEFKKLGASELVEPRLWDAFQAYSSKQESYV